MAEEKSGKKPEVRSGKKPRRFSFGKARWIGLGLLAAFLVVRVLDPGPLQTVRVKTFDFYQQLKPRAIIPDSPVVIIDLDEESLKEVGQWPWPRNQLAQLVLNLFKMGVSVVGFDVIFAEPDRMNSKSVVKSLQKAVVAARALGAKIEFDKETKDKILQIPSNDLVFGSYIQQLRKVVAGQATLPFARKYKDRKPLRTRVFEKRFKGAPKPQEWVPAVPGLLRNIVPIEKAAGGHGLLALQPEVDGIVRRIPAFFRHSKRLYPTLSLEVMRLAVGRSGVVAKGDQSGISDVTIAPRRRYLVPRTILQDDQIKKFPYDPNFNRLKFGS